MSFPADLLYTDHDEWVRVEGDEVVTGITYHAQDQLSDIVYVELPEVGDTLEKGEAYGVVESVKAASDVYMPVGGEIVAINEELEDTPEKVNEEPYGAGWFVRIKMNDPADLEDLLNVEAYQAKIAAD